MKDEFKVILIDKNSLNQVLLDNDSIFKREFSFEINTFNKFDFDIIFNEIQLFKNDKLIGIYECGEKIVNIGESLKITINRLITC